MRKILLHLIRSERIGGTTTVINEIKNSYMKDKYEFIDLVQEESCGLSPIKAIRFVNKYRKKINNEHADSIYICGLLYSGFLMCLSAKLSNVKHIVLAVHGSEWDKNNTSSLRRSIFAVLEACTVQMADAVFTVCKKGLENPAIQRGGHGNISGVIYNQMPLFDKSCLIHGRFRDEIKCGEDKILVAVVGRVVEEKGHAYIIDAIKKINDDKFVFIIVGDGDYLERYHAELPEIIKSGSVRLLGLRNDVPQILNDCDIFLFATFRENHSKALLEAVAMNCAVVCTNVGGNPEIIDDDISGIMIPPRDSDAIVAALFRMSEKNVREGFVRKANEIIPNRFSVEKTMGKLDKLFDL